MDSSWIHYIQRWMAAYAHIEDINDGVYQHEVIIHKHNFVDPYNEDIHTQNI